MNIVVGCICFFIFCLKLSDFLAEKQITSIIVDEHIGEELRIHLDVELFDLACDFVVVGVRDTFGNDRPNVTKNIQKLSIDQGSGELYKVEELMDMDLDDELTDLEKDEFDSDWASSADQFRHTDFQGVINAHEFTLVNFFADWCVHCKMFSPTWRLVEEKINDPTRTFLDETGKPVRVRAIRVNCVDFDTECKKQNVMGYPTIRVYKREIGTPWIDEFSGQREIEPIDQWLTGIVAQSNFHHDNQYHRAFKESCRVRGFIDVPRVAGTLHIHAARSQTQDIALPYTNVSHTIHSLTFGHTTPEKLPYLKNNYPELHKRLELGNGGSDESFNFVTKKMHHAPVHNLQIVPTHVEKDDMRLYQITHQYRESVLSKEATPAAKISFDVAPVQVVWSEVDKRFFSLLTSVFGVVGGTFTTIWLTWGWFESLLGGNGKRAIV